MAAPGEDDEEELEEDGEGDEEDEEPVVETPKMSGPTAAAKKAVAGKVPKEDDLAEVEDVEEEDE